MYNFSMEEYSLRELQSLQASGEMTALRLAEAYLQRIEELDQHGPTVNSVIECNPDALAIAGQLDAERRAGRVRSVLHGVPILIKDNIDTADRMHTTAGSLALLEAHPLEDAFIVQQLRRAGAVILGKTNLSEWANFRSTHSSSGWSSRGGQTRNPYALLRSPCGSSSGSGAAAAANFCAAAVGTETDGSIICPAHNNGIVGIKPTLGLVSRTGIIPIAHSQDTAGPMARTVEDAALLLNVLAGFDPADRATRASARRPAVDFAAFQAHGGLRQRRIGVARNFWGFDARVDHIMNSALDLMQRLGATLIDLPNIPNLDRYEPAEDEVLSYEFKADLNAYLARLGPDAPVKSLAEIIAFNDQNADRVMPYFGQERMLAAQAKGDLNDLAYRKARARCRRYADRLGLALVFAAERLDAIVAPSGGPAWLIDLINGDHYTGGSSSPAAVAGYPSLTVPAGYIAGLPIGLSLIGRPFDELKLIEIASDFEQAQPMRRKPEFKKDCL